MGTPGFRLRRFGTRLAATTGILVVFALCTFASVSSAASPRPANDNYLSSWQVPELSTIALHRPVSEVSWSLPGTEDTTAATTQTDLFNPDEHGLPLFGGGAEPLTCAGFSYGRTVWYDLAPDVPIEVQLVATGFPTAIAIYRWDVDTTQLIRSSEFCRVTSQSTNTSIPPIELQAGKHYTVQIGGLLGSSGFASGMLGFSVDAFPDHDGDLVLDGNDNCPFLPGVARFGGCPPTLSPRPNYSYTGVGSSVRLNALTVGTIPAGARVRVRCRACRFSEVLRAGAHATSVAVGQIAGRVLSPGAKLEIWVTRAPAKGDGPNSIYKYGAIGSYISYTVGSGAIGSRVIRCLLPGSLTPRRRCP
jgi:hypothetical protein